MENINVSIIIPNYNSADTLKKLLTSIPKRNDFQVIVVDDCSTKDVELLNEVIIQDGRCEFYRNETGVKGAGAARNVALTHVKGKWLLCADSDDYFVDGFDKIIEQYFDSEEDLIFFKPTSVDLDTGLKSDRHIDYARYIDNYIQAKTQENELTIRFDYHVPWSKIYRVSMILDNRIKFDEIIAANDVMFSVRCGMAARKILAVDNEIYCVTRHTGGLVMAKSEEILDARVGVSLRKYKFLKGNLDGKSFKRFNKANIGIIFKAYRWFGLKKALEIVRIYRDNRIPFFNPNWVKPSYLLFRIKLLITDIKNEKKYLK